MNTLPPAENSVPEMAYVSRKRCGCVGVIVMETHSKASRMVGDAIRDGEIISRETVEQVRSIGSLRCAEHKRSVAPAQEALL